MANLVLYRKYRPRTFADFIGQEHIIQTLSNAVASGQISHAYLFCGPRGTGKTSLARLLAKAVNCENLKKGQFEPCNQCGACEEINAGRAIDLIEIDAATRTGVDDVRELIDGLKFTPNRLKYKVFIIDESHQLSKSAANALLKTLEEPPAHAIFILATTEPHKMIATIISRCQRFDFKKLTLPEIIQKMETIAREEGIKIEKAALELISRYARGSLRDAESLFDQAITFCGQREIKAEDIKEILGLVEFSQIADFWDLIIKNQSDQAIKLLNQIYISGRDLTDFINTLLEYLRKALILKMGGENNPALNELTKEETEKLKSQVENLTQEKICQTLERFLEAANKIKYSPIPQLPIELAIIDLCE